jgi:hypothetical protein
MVFLFTNIRINKLTFVVSMWAETTNNIQNLEDLKNLQRQKISMKQLK